MLSKQQSIVVIALLIMTKCTVATLISAPSIAEACLFLLSPFQGTCQFCAVFCLKSFCSWTTPQGGWARAEGSVLTYQAGVCEKTCSVILLLAATGALLRGLAVILELCPARPVGAIRCHPSLKYLAASCIVMLRGVRHRYFVFATGCRFNPHNAYVNI